MADKYGDERGNHFIWLRYKDREKYAQVVDVDNAGGVGAFGEGLVAPLTPLTAWRFDYGVNSSIVSTSGTMNGGYVSGTANSQVELNTSTNVSGTAQILSIRALRYLPGFGGLCRFTAVFNSGTPNSEQMVGLMGLDGEDALAFGYDGETFGILRISSGVKYWIPMSEWNGIPLGFDLIPQYGNVYQIRFQWLGYGNIYFMVFDKSQEKFVTVHTILYPNTSEVPSLNNPTLNLFARIGNLGNNTNLRLRTPSALGALEGRSTSTFQSPLDLPNAFSRIVTFNNANNNHALTIRNPLTFLGLRNRIPLRVSSLIVSRDGASGTALNSVVKVYKNAQTAGVLSFSNVNSPNSPSQVSVTTTTVITGSFSRGFSLSQSSSQLGMGKDLAVNDLVVNPGESLTVAVENSGVQATELVVSLNWDDLF